MSGEERILVISHGFRMVSGGPAQDIRDYLKDKVALLDYIDHPFPYADFKQTYFFHFRMGILKSTKKYFYYFGFDFFIYLQQFLVTFFYVLFSRSKYDVCFALDNHSVIAVSLFRKLGRVKKLVYYSIDYTPIRFKNPFLNYLYHLADRFACKLSDINWVVAKHMIKARKDNGVDIDKVSPFVEVPMGFHKDEVDVLPLDQIDPYHLVYMGTILEKQGLQLIIQGLPQLIKALPNIHLSIIGAGDYEDAIRSLVKKNKVKTIVNFKGFIGERDKLYQILSKSGIGLAPYKPSPDSFSYFADPSKIKIYLGCGLPILTTNVTAFSKVINRRKAGVVIDYSVTSLLEGVKNLLQNRKTYTTHRQAAINLSLEYNTDTILLKAIDSL